MKKRRSREHLEGAIATARSASARARAYYNLGLFHDNNSREAEAIPHYEKALKLGLDNEIKPQALAWLASSLYKTGKPEEALERVHLSRKIAFTKDLMYFLDGLEKRIRKAI